ncbi:MAG: DJ-1/PfpI family protein [Bacilli bacterium]
MKLLTIITDGFEDLETIGTIALLRRANLEVTIAALNGPTVKGKYEIALTNLPLLKDLNIKDYDALFIPGGPQYQELKNSKLVLDTILSFANADKIVASICAGPTILGELGLLKNKNYTCFTSMNADFGGKYFPNYAVRDGNIITGISAAGTIDFAILIVEALCGKVKAEELKDNIYY